MGLSLGDMEVTQVPALLSLREPNNRCTATHHQQTLKEAMCDRSLIVMCVCYLCRDLWTHKLVAKFVRYAIIQLMHRGNCNLNLVGRWVLSNCTVVTNSYISGPCKVRAACNYAP